MTSIDGSAFEGCSSLKSITIPVAVTSIGDWAFDGCTALTDVYFTGTEEQWNAIQIGISNDVLNSATKHYGSVA